MFPCLYLSAFILVLSCALTLCCVLVDGYPSEEFDEKGQSERG